MKLRTAVVLLCVSSVMPLAFFHHAEGIEVRGTLVGYDGKPMATGYVYLHGSGIKSQKGMVDREGRFSFSLEKAGAYWLWAAGVHHKTVRYPLLLDQPGTTEISVRLATADYVAAFEKVMVIGDFNKFSTKSGAIPLEKQADGTFAATVDTKADSVSYQLYGVGNSNNEICGTQSDSFELNKDNPLISNSSTQFNSVLKAGGKPVRIVFDPQKLPRSPAETDIRLGDEAVPAARIVSLYRDINKRKERYQKALEAHMASGAEPGNFQYDWSSDLSALEHQIEREQVPTVKQYLLLQYFTFPKSDANSALAQRVYREVPPVSLGWSLLWAGPLDVFDTITRSANLPEEEDRYRQQAFDTHPDSDVRAAFLYSALSRAHCSGQADKVGRYYSRLIDEFGTSDYARMAKEIAPNRNIIAGKQVPDFTLVSLDNGSPITPLKMQGSIYLIDFWAVWCSPCVGEMKFLHQAYDKYRAKGFKILSISFDDAADDVAAFRKAKWPMPWLNARIEDGFGGKVATAFEVVGVPKPILVGKDGKIIATDGLRGEQLLQTLARVFSEAGRVQ